MIARLAGRATVGAALLTLVLLVLAALGKERSQFLISSSVMEH